jgi:hypothetical protein
MTDLVTTWRPIENFEGIYEVSDTGCVRRLIKPRARLLAPQYAGAGYLMVGLRKPREKRVYRYIHRLVAFAFLEGQGSEVNHIDGDKENNCVSNLEWASRSLNNLHKNRVLKTHHNRVEVVCVSPKGVEYETDNLTVFAEKHGMLHSGISHVLTGKRNHHHGWTFRYKDQTL